ncbi:MAG: histidine phosphotransferase family protein [Aestuariivirgaceae bacterium]|jgi:histidine phosphotransferase ChpT
MSNLLSDLDLAALLCSRVCHDIVSPVGAIANGLEMMDEDDDEEMRKLALELVRRSARQASAKLQFCRMAFGAAGGAGSVLDVGEAADIARLLVGDEKVRLDWRAPRGHRDKNEVKLLLNLMLLGIAAVPRGGIVTIEAGDGLLSATAEGDGARLADKVRAVLDRAVPAAEFDARVVQVYYAMRLAEQAGFAIAAEARSGVVAFRASRRIANSE